MANFWQEVRRRSAPVSLKIWPALSNPAWKSAGAARLFGARLHVSVAPSRLVRKIDSEIAASLRGAFLVDGLANLPSSPVNSLYTYRDMEDIARHGADWRATRLGRWLKGAIDAGRPPFVRGALITNEAEIEAYYRGYLSMYQKMREIGYRYEGDDDMCFGIGRDGEPILVRRGTHRLAAAQLLGLAVVTGRVSHIDLEFARDAVRRSPKDSVPDAIANAVTATVGA